MALAAKVVLLVGGTALLIAIRGVTRRSSRAMERAMPRKGTALRGERVAVDVILVVALVGLWLAVLFGA
jgi:hypothetical protein